MTARRYLLGPSTTLLGLCVALVTAWPMAAHALGEDVVRLNYRLGAEFVGRLEGYCQAAGFAVAGPAPPNLRIASTGGVLTVFRTWANETQVAPLQRYTLPPEDELHQDSTRYALAAGVIQIAWRTGGRGVADAGEAADAIEVEYATQRLLVRPVSLAPGEGLAYPTDVGDEVAHVPTGLTGPARMVEFDGTTATARGPLVLRFDAARVRGPEGIDVELPEYRQVQQEVGAAELAARTTVLYTHARLELHETHFEFNPQNFQVACRGLQAELEGGMILHGARGWIQRGADAFPFEEKDLALSGHFRLGETLNPHPAEQPRSEWWRVEATARGRVDAATLDFQPLALAPREAGGRPVEAGLIALIAAAFVGVASQWSRLVGLFYSRFTDGGALRHPTRTLLLRLAGERPGLILRDAVAQTGRPYGVVRHHVRVLETVGLVHTLRVGKALHVYPRGHSLAVARRSHRLEHDGPVRFLVERAATGPLDRRSAARELRARFGLSRMGAWKAVRRGLACGLVRADPASGGALVADTG